jgi:hypothetical protein
MEKDAYLMMSHQSPRYDKGCLETIQRTFKRAAEKLVEEERSPDV